MSEERRQIKRKHHYVPRFYLKHFTDPKDNRTLWVYMKGGRSPRKSRIEKEAREKDYYSITKIDGTRDHESVENMLEKFEGVIAPVLEKILSRETLNSNDRYIFSIFLGLMVVRVPGFRSNVEASYTEFMNRTNKRLTSSPSEFESFKKDYEEKFCKPMGVSFDELRRFVLEGHGLKTTHDFSLMILLSEFKEFAELFRELKWYFMISIGEFRFITSDSPLFYNIYGVESYGVYPSELRNRDFEVTLPISKDMLFLGSFTGKGGYEKVRRNKWIRDANFRALCLAQRFIYASEENLLLQNFISKRYAKGEPLVRMHIEG